MTTELGVAIEEVLGRARAAGRARLLAWVEPLAARGGQDADELVAASRLGRSSDAFVWERIEAGRRFVALGALEEFESEGKDRFAAIRDGHADLVSRLDWHGAIRPTTRPLLVGGFGFDAKACADPDWKSFPAARLVLPESIVESFPDTGPLRVAFARVEPGASVGAIRGELERRLDRGRSRDVGSAEVGLTTGEADCFAREEGGPEYRVRADRSHARFRGQIAGVLEEIASGRLSKLVLARSLSVVQDDEFDVPGFLARLRALYPSCTLVAATRGRDTFLAATPETLVRLEADRVETAALAGSAPRGRTPEEDAELAAALLASPKERAEHGHVVDAIRAVLAPRCEVLRVPDRPGRRALFGIQHLETRFEGRLRRGTAGGGSRSASGRASLSGSASMDDATSDANDVLALVEALHPTPAVAGVPAPAALEWLRRHEGLERGWYAAPIGWIDSAGGGDFSVGLRSALIRNGIAAAGQSGGGRARLFAGAGIVAGSDPEQELAETRIKLRALLAPLTEI